MATQVLDQIKSQGQTQKVQVNQDQLTVGSAFVQVSPDMAASILEETKNTGFRNRKIRDKGTSRYAQALQENWQLSNDAVSLSDRDDLLNGQHRLSSIAEGETEAPLLFIWGLPRESAEVMDVGLKRRASDTLYMNGYDHPQEMAAALRLVVLWNKGDLEQCSKYEIVENYEIQNAADKYGDRLAESLEFVSQYKNEITGVFPRSLLDFGHFLYEPTYGRRANTFVRRFTTRTGIQDWASVYDVDGVVSPAKLLRDKMDKSARSSHPMTREVQLAYMIQAMNWYSTEEPHKRLRYTGTDHYPSPWVDVLPEDVQ